MELTNDVDLSELVMDTLGAACSVDRAAIGLETTLLDLGLDSMAITAIVAQAEAACDCELTPDQIVGLFDAIQVKDLIAQISSAIATLRPSAAPQALA